MAADSYAAPSKEALHDLVSRAHGPRGAAWLAWSRKRSIHKTGAFAVLVPLGVKAPKWFTFALEAFKASPNWAVNEFKESRSISTKYVFYWTQWAGPHVHIPFKNLS